LFRKAFGHPDGAIMLAATAPPDGQRLGARSLWYVPNGIEDPAHGSRRADRKGTPTVLFVGVLLEAKGVLVLTRACATLWRGGHRFRLVFVGKGTPDIKAAVREAAGQFADRVELTGVLTGQEKWRRFAEASVFCYPTFFHSEVMPVACLEAMAFGLPVVATRWRALPEVVVDGETGHLVPVRDEAAVAERLGRLLSDQPTRARMGAAARRRYEVCFTVEVFTQNMRRIFLEAAASH